MSAVVIITLSHFVITPPCEVGRAFFILCFMAEKPQLRQVKRM